MDPFFLPGRSGLRWWSSRTITHPHVHSREDATPLHLCKASWPPHQQQHWILLTHGRFRLIMKNFLQRQIYLMISAASSVEMEELTCISTADSTRPETRSTWWRYEEGSSLWQGIKLMTRIGRCGGSTMLPYMPLRRKGHDWVSEGKIVDQCDSLRRRKGVHDRRGN